MKRKLLCIFFILAGAATIAGTIFLSRGRFPDSDTSPVYTPIFLSVITITAAARSISGWPKRSEVSGLGKFFLWVFYIVSVLAVLAGLVFVIMSVSFYYPLIFIIIFAVTIAAWYQYDKYELHEPDSEERGIVSPRALCAVSILVMLACLAFIIITLQALFHYTNMLGEMLPLMSLAAIGIAAAGVSIKLLPPSGQGKVKAVRYVPITAALAITAALCISSISLFTLVIIIIMLITIAAWFQPYSNETDASRSTRRGKVFLRAFQAVNILAILADLAFVVVMWFVTNYYTDLVKNVLTLMVLAAAGIAAAALSLKMGSPVSAHGKARASRCIPLSLAVITAAALCFVYISYISKFSLDAGMNMLRSREELSQKDVFYPASHMPGEPDAIAVTHGSEPFVTRT